MAERDDLVAALAAEVLGPRSGLRERLEASPHRAGELFTPLEEYITGVLAPKDSKRHPEMTIDSDDDLLGEQENAADDQGDTGEPAVPVGVSPTAGAGRSPALDPRARPCSIGLSVLVTGERPRIDVCSTWAWYEMSGQTAWIREPRLDLWTGIDCTVTKRSRPVVELDGVRRIEIEVRCRPNSGGGWRVSIFLVNATTVAERPGPEHHVYQPQIRVRCEQGTRLLAIDDDVVHGDGEAATLALLYSARRAFARGHLCAAVWKDVDPEQPFAGGRPQGAPFTWLDGALLPPGEAAGFSPPDARTELVPAYLIAAPALDATAAHGAAVFDPERLSSLWDPTQLRDALSPLAAAYDAWIVRQDQRIPQLPQARQTTAAGHLQQCREALRRIRSGIDILCSDEDSRLAFCFANRAISLQSRWTRRGRVDPWRPFQLAFQLLNLEAIRDDRASDRLACDLLWIPTGGGKTEAYLGLTAFTFALRRLRAARDNASDAGAGVSILSRYTLRLLTIQQFRRALTLVTACERLRTTRAHGVIGWRPAACPNTCDGLWGNRPFSIGLWVGGGVTPNGLFSFRYPTPAGRMEDVWGALDILTGADRGAGDGEPAQVLSCPACRAVLAIPPNGYRGGRAETLHLVVECVSPNPVNGTALSGPMENLGGGQAPVPLFAVTSAQLTTHAAEDFHTLSIKFVAGRDVSPLDVDLWVRQTVVPALGRRARLVPARGARPGYFVRTAMFQGGGVNPVDFEIYCPNPRCELNTGDPWSAETPGGAAPVVAAFSAATGGSTRMPIPAVTVDDQVYGHCPTVIVATVDKFARLAFEPRAAALFGGVDHWCDRHGYYRAGCPPNRRQPTRPADHPVGVTPIRVSPFAPPDLVLQDELHLIEGPLGSMVGLYETAVEVLASRQSGSHRRRPKYVASSATVRKAAEQVQSLFDRRLAQFPPPGLEIDDNFFTTSSECHPLDAGRRGRLYVGVCAPGRGAQTPIVRIWSRLLQQVEFRRRAGSAPADLDPFWTLVGYFNAIRELAGAVALARQDIPERMAFVSPAPRLCPEQEPMELSSRASSLDLPAMLERLDERFPSADVVGTVASTSMFGTGVDVSRLGLMVVHGQPKTSSSYIQATGRVGREGGGLVVTFYRASRPRDLSHFEFFFGFHRELYRHVEPITVSPFAARARDRALGPVSVVLLRQASELPGPAAPIPVSNGWRIQQQFNGGCVCRASDMAAAQSAPEVLALPTIFETRAASQPNFRRPQSGLVAFETQAELARWAQLAQLTGPALRYHESSMVTPPVFSVVLGDLAHEMLGISVAFENAPNSLREVESTTTFRARQ
jgi:helicase-like protein